MHLDHNEITCCVLRPDRSENIGDCGLTAFRSSLSCIHPQQHGYNQDAIMRTAADGRRDPRSQHGSCCLTSREHKWATITMVSVVHVARNPSHSRLDMKSSQAPAMNQNNTISIYGNAFSLDILPEKMPPTTFIKRQTRCDHYELQHKCIRELTLVLYHI